MSPDKADPQREPDKPTSPYGPQRDLIDEAAGGADSSPYEADPSGEKVEHYEIAMYGCLCTWAKRLGYATAQTLLHQSLEEEKRTDEKLTRLAESQVNVQAAAK